MNTTPTAQSALSDIQLKSNETLNNDSNLVERKPIPGTPFTHIKQDGKWFIVMGDYRLTDTEEDEQKSLEKLVTEYWQIIVTICAIVTEKLQEKQKLSELQKDTPYETESL